MRNRRLVDAPSRESWAADLNREVWRIQSECTSLRLALCRRGAVRAVMLSMKYPAFLSHSEPSMCCASSGRAPPNLHGTRRAAVGCRQASRAGYPGGIVRRAPDEVSASRSRQFGTTSLKTLGVSVPKLCLDPACYPFYPFWRNVKSATYRFQVVCGDSSPPLRTTLKLKMLPGLDENSSL